MPVCKVVVVVKSNEVTVEVTGVGSQITVDVADSTTSQPIQNAHAIMAGTTAESDGYTDASGMWTSKPLPAGNYLLTVTADGYDIYQKDIPVAITETVPVDMNPTAPNPPGPNAFFFVSFTPSRSVPASTWKNTTSQTVQAICFVTAKNSLGQVVGIGETQVENVPAGASFTFNVILDFVLAAGTYNFGTACTWYNGAPISQEHEETDTV